MGPQVLAQGLLVLSLVSSDPMRSPMRVTAFSILALLGAGNVVGAQVDGTRELEGTCIRLTDDPRPATIESFQPLIDRESGARASFLRGCRLLAEQKFGPAGSEFEKAVRVEPGNAVFHFWFGRASGEQVARANPLRQPGLARRTKGEFEKAVALDSAYVSPREGLVRYYLAAPRFVGGGIDRARQQAEEIAKLNPYRGGLAHANVAFAAKDTLGLIRVHEELIDQFPDSIASYFALVNVQLTRKQWALAWSAVDRLERIQPELPATQYAVGRVAAESGEQLDRGESALRFYLLHTPQPDEPSLALTHWRLGVIAEHRGDTAAARQAYQSAAAMDPRLKQAREALSRLK
jgi:tetratricopeptide (TPR) repeat protein